MSPITCTLISVFTLISLALFLLFRLNPFAVEQNPLKKRRLILTGTRLKITERISFTFKPCSDRHDAHQRNFSLWCFCRR